MKRSNIYPISDRMKIPKSMVQPVERLSFRDHCKEVVAWIVVLASAVLCVFALGVIGAI